MQTLKNLILSVVFALCVYGLTGSYFAAMITGNLPWQKVTEPTINCFKIITSKETSFETPSIQLMDRMERKGYKITECDI